MHTDKHEHRAQCGLKGIKYMNYLLGSQQRYKQELRREKFGALFSGLKLCAELTLKAFVVLGAVIMTLDLYINLSLI